jgi:hypothetical protein
MIRGLSRRGLTRVEATVVAGITVIVFTLVLPAVEKVRAGASGKVCQNNLAQIALATLDYYDVYGSFPPGMDDQYVGELVRLLPFVGRPDLYKNFSFDPQYSLYFANPYNRPPSDGTDNIPRPPDLYGCEGEVDLFLCPEGPQPNESVTAVLIHHYGTAGIDYRADDGLGNVAYVSASPGRLVLARSHYLGMAGEFRHQPPYYDCYRGIFRYNSHTRFEDLERGAANTILYAETWGAYTVFNGGGGIPNGFVLGSRSAGFNYSSFGTCPNYFCDFSPEGLGLGAAFGALHPTKDGGFGFNVVMADGSTRLLPGNIDFIQWITLCGIGNCGARPRGGLEPDEADLGID